MEDNIIKMEVGSLVVFYISLIITLLKTFILATSDNTVENGLGEGGGGECRKFEEKPPVKST